MKSASTKKNPKQIMVDPDDPKERILNCLESSQVDQDWNMDTAINSQIILGAFLPRQVDLREQWWRVQDQGSTGSCVGWATADSVLRWHFVKQGLLSKKKLLSVRFVWMASKETDVFDNRPSTFIEASGTSLKASLDIARHYGCVKDAELPFDSGQLFQASEQVFYSLASGFKIRSYYNLNIGDKLRNWKMWLAAGGGPILTRLNVDDTWRKATQNKGLLDKYSDNRYGGHAVAVVGYKNDQFIIRNSWGEDWGDKGYAYATAEYAKAAFTESYGVKLFNPPA